MAPFWIEWYLTTDLVPPRGFVGWKGRLLSRAHDSVNEPGDPRFKDLLRDGVSSAVRVEEIHFAGRRYDGGPSLDHPKMLPAAEAQFLAPSEPVYGIQVNGEPRAYPLRIVDWHRAVNDEVGGVPLSLTCCALAGAAVCYDTRDSKGRAHLLSPAALVYRGNELLFDKESSSLWCQITGQCLLGMASQSEIRLRPVPLVLPPWRARQRD